MTKKVFTGKVISDKMDKTIVVAVEHIRMHERYGKQIVSTRKFKAHDEENKCKTGDIVQIIEHRPISKTKRWILGEVVRKAE